MAKKPQTIISDIRCASDLPPELGNKFVTKQLANLLKTTNCTMQLATCCSGVKELDKPAAYGSGVKLLVNYPHPKGCELLVLPSQVVLAL